MQRINWMNTKSTIRSLISHLMGFRHFYFLHSNRHHSSQAFPVYPSKIDYMNLNYVKSLTSKFDGVIKSSDAFPKYIHDPSKQLHVLVSNHLYREHQHLRDSPTKILQPLSIHWQMQYASIEINWSSI